MKLALRHPSGLEIEFEGDTDEFDRFAQFLAGEVGGFVRGLNANEAEESADTDPDAAGEDEETAIGQTSRSLGRDSVIDAKAVYARWTEVGASTEIERVTIVAQAAIDAGLEGIDYKTIDRIYDDVGQPKPPRFPKAFFNAKEKGFLRSVKHGVWAPTIKGQNYARYGTKPPARGRRLSTGSPAPQGPAGELPAGGVLTGG